jgi:DNA-binding NtrC family response regulator
VRILIVEPQFGRSSILQVMLSEAGHDVSLAHGVEEAIDVVKRQSVAVVVVSERLVAGHAEMLSNALRTVNYTGRILSTDRLGELERAIPSRGED